MRLAVFLAVFVGVAGAALAQDGAPPLWFGFADAAWGLVAVLVVNVVTLFARSLAPETLRPVPSTPRSRRLSQLVALSAGLVTGLIGLVPVTPVDLPWADDMVGRVVSGLIVAGVAVFGRDRVVRGMRRAKGGE